MSLKKTLLIFSLSLLSYSASAASETTTFFVNGNTSCEEQIELVITNIDGVTSASWDATSKMITIVFENQTIQKDRFFVALAESGYDNQELQAKKYNYDKLSEACKYVRVAAID